jgi:proteasome lid subunit RPN8/RPN11
MKAITTVSIDQELLQTILESSRRLYPRETMLLLRGEKKKDMIEISELLVPPLAVHGQSSAHIPLHMLPMDFSIVGTVHSHPSGDLAPSVADLNHFFGIILMIAGFPFADETNIVVYDNHGDRLTLQIRKT